MSGGRRIGKLRIRGMDDVASVAWGTPADPESTDVIEITLKSGRSYFVTYIHEFSVDGSEATGPKKNNLFIALFCTVCVVE